LIFTENESCKSKNPANSDSDKKRKKMNNEKKYNQPQSAKASPSGRFGGASGLLLNKYFEGETSSAEELQLRQYFRSGKVADEHKAYKPLFAYFDEEIDAQKKAEKPKSKHIIFPKRHLFYYISAAAAFLRVLSNEY
jgi:hypothetical protein